jgi:NAD+ synthase (glutamine-hydrolysing)
MGGLDYKLHKSGMPDTIRNCIFHVSSDGVNPIYTKQLLPNYDIFEEKKYFEAGNTKTVLEINSKKIGFLICEDMWSSSIHKYDPVTQLAGEELDLVVNLSASPFNMGKSTKRINRASDISNFLKCPFIYVNQVSGEDEILFDGRSFVQDSSKTEMTGDFFKATTIDYKLESKKKYKEIKLKENSNTWETLFTPMLDDNLKLTPLTDEECHEIFEALKFGFKEYSKKCGFNNFTIALSGGMDSALVLTIMRLALKEGQYLEAVYMPSIYSSPLSYDLSLKLTQNLGIPLYNLPIKFLHSTAKNVFGQTFNEKFEGITDENIQSRLRGTLLYTRSNQINSMVVNTSNKSELAVGYSTQYGDSVGAISLLGDLYKSQVFSLAKYINRKFNNAIPEEIISRPPTAELRENQEDSQSLPEYDILDSILESILSNRHTKDELLANNFKEEDVDKVLNLYRRSEFKRYQFCPIIKVSTRSFGFGYRIPITKNSNFYINNN